jgi:hypothetical protein
MRTHRPPGGAYRRTQAPEKMRQSVSHTLLDGRSQIIGTAMVDRKRCALDRDARCV